MTACPSDLAFARALSEGGDAALVAHLAECAACRAQWDGQTRAIELARRYEVPKPTADRREEMRTAILASRATIASTTRPRRGGRQRWWGVGAGVAAIVAVMFAARTTSFLPSFFPSALPAAPSAPAPPRPHVHGTVTAHGGASYVVSATSPDELVALSDGTIGVEVAPLHRGERFRVITADAELEVRGTSFEVTARRGRLIAVTVQRGRVEARPHGRAPISLGAGESWTAPERAVATSTSPPRAGQPSASEPPGPPEPPELPRPAAPALATPARAASASTRVASSAPARRERAQPRGGARRPRSTAGAPAAAAPASARSPSDRAYDLAWAAMRAEQFSQAATAFARVAILEPEGALAEDAGYWYAVALGRAGRSEAAAAFREFLERYPGSPHAGEASAMLGWILVAAKERAEAERRFRAAIADPRPSVRASARAGLAAL